MPRQADALSYVPTPPVTAVSALYQLTGLQLSYSHFLTRFDLLSPEPAGASVTIQTAWQTKAANRYSISYI